MSSGSYGTTPMSFTEVLSMMEMTSSFAFFADPPVDTLYKESFEMAENARTFSVEFLPGQFD